MTNILPSLRAFTLFVLTINLFFFNHSLIAGEETNQSLYLVLLKEPQTPILYKARLSDSSLTKYRLVRSKNDYVQGHYLRPFLAQVQEDFFSKGLIATKNTFTFKNDSQNQNQNQSEQQVEFLPLLTSIKMSLTREQVKELKQFSEVEKIIPNTKVYLEGDDVAQTQQSNHIQDPSTLNTALLLHGVDKLINEGVDINHPGKVVGIVDTGVDGSHPDLQGKVIQYFRPSNGTHFPIIDTSFHGTHVSGIIAGGALTGTQIGLYPGAKLVVAAGLEKGTAELLSALNWMFDPDGDANTNDQPFVINNSWNIGDGDPTPYYRVLEAFKDADILACFSAGNSGHEGITRPKEHPLAFSSGALDQAGQIGSFSSWGPALYKDQKINKPDLSSMGVDVYSTLPQSKYGLLSGTSMASPATAAAIALLGSYFPQMSPYKIAQVLVETATPINPGPTPPTPTIILRRKPNQLKMEGMGEWDKQYGYGKLNVYAAYHQLLGY